MSNKKLYSAHVLFKAIRINVMAKNYREAKRKIYAKLSKKKPMRLLDKDNSNLYEF